jgi:hypothetical protein
LKKIDPGMDLYIERLGGYMDAELNDWWYRQGIHD